MGPRSCTRRVSVTQNECASCSPIVILDSCAQNQYCMAINGYRVRDISSVKYSKFRYFEKLWIHFIKTYTRFSYVFWMERNCKPWRMHLKGKLGRLQVPLQFLPLVFGFNAALAEARAYCSTHTPATYRLSNEQIIDWFFSHNSISMAHYVFRHSFRWAGSLTHIWRAAISF